MSDADLSHAINFGENFLSRIQIAEFECDNAVMRRILSGDISVYEAYLLGKDLHRNVLEMLEEESLYRHKNKKTS